MFNEIIQRYGGLLPGIEILDHDVPVGQFVTENDGMSCIALAGILEQFAEVAGGLGSGAGVQPSSAKFGE